MAEAPELLLFDDFTVHRRERSLRKRGARLRLHGQAFDILLMLLDRPGQVVTREELKGTLWPRTTFVDVENGLNAAVKRLRHTLGDSAESPRYIETLPRVGYRFLGEVSAGTSAPQPAVSAPGPRGRRRWLPAGIAVVIAGLVVAAVWYVSPPRGGLSDADLVLVSDLVNTTGDPVFDGTLKRAVLVKLGESPHFNVLNEPNLRATLRLMERPPSTRLVPPLDREVCQRAGAKVVIGGAIAALGDSYTLSLEARNCLSGELVAHEEGRASGRERVLPTLGDMLPPFRRRLGESLATIERFNTPIAQATTASLSALKAYAMGDEDRLQDKEEESLAFYKMAVELDPQFAIAWTRLAAVYRILGHYDLSREAMARAFQLREHVSEKEQLYIAAHYYVDYVRDYSKAIQTYELWTQIYPRDWIPYNNLADAAALSGLYDKAIPAGEQALRLNPNSWFAYGTLANAYLRAGRYAEARAICDRAAVEHHVAPLVAMTAARIPYVLGDRAAIDAEIAAAAGPQQDQLVVVYVAQATSGLARLKQARQLYGRALQAALERGEREYAANNAYDESLAEAELGDAAGAKADVARALEWNPDPAAGVYAALTLARVGETQQAAALAKAADVRPDDTLHNAVALPAARAAIALAQHEPQRAIEALRAALTYDLSEVANGETLYLRGVAYLELGSPQAAAGQFQRLIDNHGSALTVYWPLAHLGLARAYAADGKPQQALEMYRSLLGVWSDADTGLPVLQQARAEYQRLSKGGN